MKNGKQNGRSENGRYEKGSNGGAHGIAGKSGRPSDEFRATMREIIEDPKVKKAFVAILRDKEHPQFAALWKTAAAYAVGQPAQVVQHSGGIEINVRDEREVFESRMARLATRVGANRLPVELN